MCCTDVKSLINGAENIFLKLINKLYANELTMFYIDFAMHVVNRTRYKLFSSSQLVLDYVVVAEI